MRSARYRISKRSGGVLNDGYSVFAFGRWWDVPYLVYAAYCKIVVKVWFN